MLKRHWPCVLISVIVALATSFGLLVMTTQAQDVTHDPSGIVLRIYVVEDYECIQIYDIRNNLHWQCFAPPESGPLGRIVPPP